MTPNELIKKIAVGEVNGVYLFEGPEETLKQETVEALRKRLLPEGFETFNETVLEDTNENELIEAAETLPFMADKRLVIAKDPLFLKGKSKAEPKRLYEWLKTPPADSITVLYIRGSLNKSQKLADRLNWISFQSMEERELEERIKAEAKTFGKNINPQDASYLIFTVGHDLGSLLIETRKLASFIQDRKTITVEDIDAAVTPGVEASVFKMIDALMDRNSQTAFTLLNGLINAGESYSMIMSMLTRQMRLLAHVKCLKAKNKGVNDIMKITDQKSSYAVNRLLRSSAQLDENVLKNGYLTCTELEFAARTSQMREAEATEKMMLTVYDLKKIGDVRNKGTNISVKR